MKQQNIKLLSLVVLVVVYNFFFWGEKLGLNLFIFNLLLTVASLLFNRSSWRANTVKITVFLTFTAACMVLIHNSLVSKIAYFASFFLMLAFIHETRLKSILYGLGYVFTDFFESISQGILGLTVHIPHKIYHQNQFKVKLIGQYIKLAVIPIIVFIIFFILFKVGNPVFDSLSNELGLQIQKWSEILFFKFSFLRLLFMVLGVFLIGLALYKRDLAFLAEAELKQQDFIERKKSPEKNAEWSIQIKSIALKNEYRMGVMMIWMVNLLLLAVNVIDVQFLWIGFDFQKAINYKDMVHNGTYMLITSILLSIGILIYFFRKNLNFYPYRSKLKPLAYVWIFQNSILVFSVALRTYYYIHQYGLAYKRIGVLIFLCLTLFGLYTMYRKILGRKSAYYLLRMNSWAVYVMLICMSLVNWDILIVSYNLKHHSKDKKTDVAFLLTLSDKTLHLVHQNTSKIDMKDTNSNDFYRIQSRQQHLDSRIKDFMAYQKSLSWLSWNYADYQTYQYFKKDKRDKIQRIKFK
jgi:hypothetical protein